MRLHLSRLRNAGGSSSPARALFLAGFLFALAAIAQAQQPPAPAPGAAPQSEASDGQTTITFAARRMESVIAKGKEKTVLIGQAVVHTGTMEIKADRIELS
ncbi:MAG: hypothetical protein ACYC1A_03120, partial [Spirochaetales bacterium]